MISRLNPYLSFRDNTKQAMEFYQSVFGGKLDLSTYAENGMTQSPEEGSKIMHAMLEAENGITFMAADTPNSMDFHAGSNISMSLSGDNEAELSRYFELLAAGGTITEPLVKAPWGDTFGMLTDQFEVKWMVNITAAQG